MVLGGAGQGSPTRCGVGDRLPRTRAVGLAGAGAAVAPVAGLRGDRDARPAARHRPDPGRLRTTAGMRLRDPTGGSCCSPSGGWALIRAVVSLTWRDPAVIGSAQCRAVIALTLAVGSLAGLGAIVLRGRATVPAELPGAPTVAPGSPEAEDTSRVLTGPDATGRSGTTEYRGGHAQPPDRRPRRRTTRGHPMTQVAEPGAVRTDVHPRVGSATGSTAAACAGTSGREGPVYDPATGQLARHVDFASVEEVDAAVAAAKAAFPAWRATSISKRTDIMFRIRNLVEQHRHELAAHLTAEHGKVPSDALGEIARGLENLEFATRHPAPAQGRLQRAGLDRRRRLPDPPAARRRGRHHAVQLPGHGPDVDVRAPPSPCGNTFILKPSEKDPSASIFLAELLHEAGVPDGVFNVVHGDKVAVDAHPRAPGHRRRQLRRLDADRALHLRDRHHATASASRPSAAPRTT